MTSIDNKPTLTVGIPAFNEEMAIVPMVKSILSQKQGSYVLKNISIYSDGSKDKTAQNARLIQKKSKLINVFNDRVRRGKYFRMNQMFKSLKTDFLVILDADIALCGNGFLDKLVRVLINDKGANMVTAHHIPLRADNFVAKVIHTSFALWDNVRLDIPDCDHVQNFYGAATAFRKSFVQDLLIPDNVNELRMYLYATAKKSNSFRYCHSAKIIYWPVTTMHDFVKLSNRTFGTKNVWLESIFGKDIGEKYIVPRKHVIRGVVKTFIQYPIHTPLALLLSIYVSKIRPESKINNTPLWEISNSSKRTYQDAYIK